MCHCYPNSFSSPLSVHPDMRLWGVENVAVIYSGPKYVLLKLLLLSIIQSIIICICKVVFNNQLIKDQDKSRTISFHQRWLLKQRATLITSPRMASNGLSLGKGPAPDNIEYNSCVNIINNYQRLILNITIQSTNNGFMH